MDGNERGERIRLYCSLTGKTKRQEKRRTLSAKSEQASDKEPSKESKRGIIFSADGGATNRKERLLVRTDSGRQGQAWQGKERWGRGRKAEEGRNPTSAVVCRQAHANRVAPAFTGGQ